jgi:hypothetical protein
LLLPGSAPEKSVTWPARCGSPDGKLKYEESVKAGKYLVIAHGTPVQVATANKTLEGTKPAELNLHERAA